MKYEVTHSFLTSPTRTFKRGEFATEQELTDAGFGIEHLLKNGAVEPLKGTGPDEKRAELPIKPKK